MQLITEKQENILRLINRFGVITSTQLIEYFEGVISHVTIYTTKKKLLSLGLIDEKKLGKQLVLFIKPTGVTYIGSDLTAFTKINITMLEHQLLMNDCLIALKRISEQKGNEFVFKTERELRSEYLAENFSPKDRQNTTKLKQVADRIPDFVVIEGGEQVACEVELTQKSSKRYIEKLALYKDECLNGRYRFVRYLCKTDKIRQTVATFAQQAGLDKTNFQIELIGRVIEIGKKQ